MHKVWTADNDHHQAFERDFGSAVLLLLHNSYANQSLSATMKLRRAHNHEVDYVVFLGGIAAPRNKEEMPCASVVLVAT